MKINGWLIFGITMSILYAFGAYVFGINEITEIKKFSELELNNQGDALAGFFAPLAFLWLFIATMIQSQELRLQREEMEENRKVMKEQADAAKEQASFISAQTETMQKQTKMLSYQGQDSHRAAQFNLRIQLFDKRIEIYTTMVNIGNRLKKGGYDFHEPLTDATNKSVFLFENDVTDWLAEIREKLDERWKLYNSLSSVLTRLQMQGAEAVLTDDEQERLSQCKEVEKWMKSQFDKEKMLYMFVPYLVLRD